MKPRPTPRTRILDAVDRFRQNANHPDAVASAASQASVRRFVPADTLQRLAAHELAATRVASNDDAETLRPSQTLRRLIVHSIDHMETMHDLSRAEAQQTVRKRISMPTMRISMEFAAGLL